MGTAGPDVIVGARWSATVMRRVAADDDVICGGDDGATGASSGGPVGADDRFLRPDEPG